MTGIAAIHDALGDVYAAAGDVQVRIYIWKAIDRAAVDAHSQLGVGIILQVASDLSGAAQWSRRVLEKHHGHAIAGGQRNERSSRLGATELVRAGHKRLEVQKNARRVIHWWARVPHQVHEEDVRKR